MGNLLGLQFLAGGGDGKKMHQKKEKKQYENKNNQCSNLHLIRDKMQIDSQLTKFENCWNNRGGGNKNKLVRVGLYDTKNASGDDGMEGCTNTCMQISQIK